MEVHADYESPAGQSWSISWQSSYTYKSARCQVMRSSMLSHNPWSCPDSVVVDLLAVRSAVARLDKSTWHRTRSSPTILAFGHAIACDIGHKPDPVPI